MKNSKVIVEKLQKPLELEAERKELEHQNSIDEGMLPSYDFEKSSKQKNVVVRDRNKIYNKSRIFNHDLDKCDQSHADIYDGKKIFRDLEKGKQVPLGSVKENGVYTLDTFNEHDLTDMRIIDQRYRELYGDDYMKVYQETLDSENAKHSEALEVSKDDLDSSLETSRESSAESGDVKK